MRDHAPAKGTYYPRYKTKSPFWMFFVLGAAIIGLIFLSLRVEESNRRAIRQYLGGAAEIENCMFIGGPFVCYKGTSVYRAVANNGDVYWFRFMYGYMSVEKDH